MSGRGSIAGGAGAPEHQHRSDQSRPRRPKPPRTRSTVVDHLGSASASVVVEAR